MVKSCFQSVLDQSLSGLFDFELIVVINHTADIASEDFFSQGKPDIRAIPVRIIFEPHPGIPAVRNMALADAISSGKDFVAFIDDDCVAEPDWLENLISPLIAGEADVTAGGWSIEPSGKPSRFIPGSSWGKQDYKTDGIAVADGGLLRTAYTRNVAFKSSSPGLVGRTFNLTRTRRGGSDVIFFMEATRSGAKIIYAPSAQVTEFYSGERLKLSWHVQRKIRNVQFQLERATLLEDPVIIARSFSGALFGLVLRVAKIPIKFVPRHPRNLRFLKSVSSSAGEAAVFFARIWGVFQYFFRRQVEPYGARAERKRGHVSVQKTILSR